MKNIKKIVILLLIICFSIEPIAVLSSGDNTVNNNEKIIIELYTEEQFLSFSQDCKLDSFSKDKKVILKNDIDLSEYDFQGVPIFLGEFDGNNNTISGININTKEDYQGVFRYISEGATVSNLNIEGVIEADADYIGGIVGQNKGDIFNCEFNGEIIGNSHVGGIAGENIGTIVEAESHGIVLGQSIIGGLVGENTGTIIRGENNSEVNTEIINNEVLLEDIDIVSLRDDLLNSDIVDIGGIAGVNLGVIQNSSNNSNIGYSHIGYNIGGIAGRHSGYISSCENTGYIFGRKDVGGIVGQFEPYISYIYSTSKLENLQQEVITLSSMTSDLASSTKLMNESVSSQITNLNNSLNSTKADIDDLFDKAEDTIEAGVESLNTINILVVEVMDKLLAILENLNFTVEDLESILNYLEELDESLLNISDDLEGDTEENKIVSENIEEATKYLYEAIENIEDIKSNIEGIIKENNENESIKEETKIALNNVKEKYELAIKNIGSAFDYISKVKEDVEKLGDYKNISDVQKLELLQDVIEELEYGAELIKDLIIIVNEEVEKIFATTSDDYNESKEKLSNSLNDVSESIEGLNQVFSVNAEIVIDDIENINTQFNLVMTLMIDILTDVMSIDGENIFEVDDISYENSSDITTGKITSSNNNGKINGDINIGGISGTISFEISFDREDDYKNEGNTIEQRNGIAIIDNSINTGDIEGKKNHIGGIVGYMDFGFVEECTSISKVESIEGSYVGGIAGYSESKINSSYSKSILLGKSYIGGIVGYGKDIEYSYSMSSIDSENGFKGGIAGYIKEDGALKENFFVSDNLGGISGISFEGKAEPIGYSELIGTSDDLEVFKDINIEFFIDNIKVDVIEVSYMASVLEEDIPLVPERDGYYGYWEPFSTSAVKENIRVSAIYEPIITTIESDKSIGKLSDVLVDGNFSNRDELNVSEYKNNEKDTFEGYKLELNNKDKTIDKVRYLAVDTIDSVEVLEDSNWVKVDIDRDGKYIVFENINDTNEVIFRTIKSKNTYIPILIAFLLLILALGYLIYKQKYKLRIKTI